MLHDNLPDVPKDQIGYYAGLVESLFAVVQFLTGMVWGSLSDRIGRKPVLLIGLAGTFVSVNAFGLAKSFPAMILARAINGLMNGNIAVIKSVLGELTDDSNQARAFTFLPLMFAIGSIIGPAIGGTLSDPANTFPHWFGRSQFLKSYPYWLPCGVAGLLNLFGLLVGFLFLQETLPSKVKAAAAKRSADAASASASLSSPSNAASASQTPRRLQESGQATPRLSHRLSEPDLVRASLSRASSKLSPRALESEFHAERRPLLQNSDERVSHTQPAATSPITDEEKPAAFKEIFKPKILTVLFNQALINLINVAYMSALPLFCFTPIEKGGLDFTKQDVGTILAANGVLAIFIQLFLFPFLEKRLGGPQHVLKRSLPFMASTFLFFPLAHVAARLGRAEVWTVLGAMLVFKSIGGISIVSGTLCINNVAPNRASLGRVNGLGQSLGSLSRAVGPISSTSLFAWSITHPQFLDGQLVWIAFFLLAFGTWSMSLRIRDANKAAWRHKGGQAATDAARSTSIPRQIFTTLRLNADQEGISSGRLQDHFPEPFSSLLAQSRADASVPATIAAHRLHQRIPFLAAHLQRLHDGFEALHQVAPDVWPDPSLEPVKAAMEQSVLLAKLDGVLGAISEAKRVRVAMDRCGHVEVEHFALSPTPAVDAAVSVRLDTVGVASSLSREAQVLMRHKTMARKVYDEAREHVGATLLPAGKPAGTCFDVLLWQQEGEAESQRYLTESSIANIVLELSPTLRDSSEVRFVTPHSKRPLLPGLARQELVRRGLVQERDISIQELRRELDKGGRLWLVNALRGAWPVALVD
ncbi:mfs general substrate transporter [Ceraceosorus bombacis]|uniref:Mfs general substrate transporter n=1 Tax=Ceraceosorus bombacis TaxID=401625 RepID=A0A0P1BBQ9_9BASI|nr:mfs general substrate transporter [Ceraceosorus bombacis]